MRGEFRRTDGLVIPNNVTVLGSQAILDLAFLNTDTGFYMGLGSGVFTPDMTTIDLNEPTIGVNGYARIPISRDALGWPNKGLVNGEAFVESKSCVFSATGTGFDKDISRMFLTGSINGTEVLAISNPLPGSIHITPTTIEALRTFRYRFYLG